MPARGTVRDWEGKPSPRARVVLSPEADGVRGHQTLTDEHGAFAFEHVAEGAYQLRASRRPDPWRNPLASPGSMNSYAWTYSRDMRATGQRVALENARTIEGVELSLPRRRFVLQTLR